MLGMEKMLASLIGMEPEELQAKVKEVENVFQTLASALNSLAKSSQENRIVLNAIVEKVLTADQKEKLASALAEFEREQNGQRTNDDN